MDDNISAEPGKFPDNIELDQPAEIIPVQKLSACGLRSSTRLLNKQKLKSEDINRDIASGSGTDGQCKCNLASCESCSHVTSNHEALLAAKKRDFWTVQEQQDFFDGLKLYGKDFHSVSIHMKSVAKRRARMMNTASSNVSSDNVSQAATDKIKTKEQLRHFYYRKLQLCQRFVSNCSSSNSPSQPRDLREVYLLLCYDALKKIFRDKLDPRLARPDFAFHLGQMITCGSTVVRVGRKGRFRVKAPVCQALRSWNFAPAPDGRGSGSGDQQEVGDNGATATASGYAADGKGLPLTNLPSVIVVELVPSNNFSWSFVQSVAHNPRIAISAMPTTKLDELRVVLEEKWRPRLGMLEPIQEQIAIAERITVNFRIPGEANRSTSDATTSQPENQEPSGAGAHKLNGIATEVLLQMSLIELFLLMEKDLPTAVKDNSVQLEYSIMQQQQTSEFSKAVISPALNKLLFFASIRLKLLAQQQQAVSLNPTSVNLGAGNRLLSPSSSKVSCLPRIDEEGQNMESSSVSRRPPNVITPRRRNQRKVVTTFPQQQNVVATSLPVPNMPTSNAVALNFIEQLKELRGRSQRKNRTAVAVEPNQTNLASEQHSPRILQQRRLIPKPVPVGIVESQMRLQAMQQQASNFRPPPVGSSLFLTGNSSQVVASSLDPNVNIVITPLQVPHPSSRQHFQQYMECSTQGSQQQQLPVASSSYVPAFGDASLDISLPGESTMVELLKPPFSTPSATSLNQAGDIRNDNRTANVLDLGSMGIVSGRPISPNATAGFDISFGDPSFGGLLGPDAPSTASLVNKNNSMTPWLMQESSMNSLFESAGPGAFDDASFLLPANQSQQPQNTR